MRREHQTTVIERPRGALDWSLVVAAPLAAGCASSHGPHAGGNVWSSMERRSRWRQGNGLGRDSCGWSRRSGRKAASRHDCPDSKSRRPTQRFWRDGWPDRFAAYSSSEGPRHRPDHRAPSWPAGADGELRSPACRSSPGSTGSPSACSTQIMHLRTSMPSKRSKSWSSRFHRSRS